jgi:iron complex outermembrane receptor protein
VAPSWATTATACSRAWPTCRSATPSPSASPAATRSATARSRTCWAAATWARPTPARPACRSAGPRPSKLDADLILNYEADHPTGTAFKSNTFNPTNPVTGQALGDRDPNTRRACPAATASRAARALGLKRFVQGATALVDYRFNDAWSLSSITAARHFASDEVFDPDGFSLPMFVFAEDARGTQYSQELRLNYDNGGKVSWFGGVSYFDEDAQTRVPLQFDERYALALLTGQLTKPNPQPTAVLTNTAFLSALVTGLTGGAATARPRWASPTTSCVHTEQFTNYGTTQSWDVYGDATWHVTDRFELSAGLRYTRRQVQRHRLVSVEPSARSWAG